MVTNVTKNPQTAKFNWIKVFLHSLFMGKVQSIYGKYLISFSIIPYFHKYSTLQYQMYTYVTKKYFETGVVSAETLIIFHNLLGYYLSMHDTN